MPATDDYLRSPKMMHQVFCASAVLLFAVTIWMMWADYNDEWRDYQRTSFNLIAARDKKRETQIKDDPTFQKNVAELKGKLTEAKTQLGEHEKSLDAKKDEANKAKIAADDFLRDLKIRRAERDVARADYNLGVRDNVSNLSQLLDKYTKKENQVQGMEAEYIRLSHVAAQAKAELGQVTADRDTAEANLKKAENEITMIHAAIQKIAPEKKNWDGTPTWADWWMRTTKLDLMQLPIVDGFNGRERIAQDWMPKLEIDLGGMGKVARFDRCRTCHVMIDAVDSGAIPAFPAGDKKDGKYNQPFSSHPRLDLYLTSSSPHPLPKFGCTVCHEGQGSGTSFTNASHSPNDPAEMLKWEHQHKWFDNHFWEHPMYPQRFQESGCIKCHMNVTELAVNDKFGPTAPKVARGYDLVKTYGCFGCHDIAGFDGTKIVGPDLRLEPATAEEADRIAKDPLQVAGKMRKVGPSLRHSASKSDQGFIAYWTEEPRRFRPTTRMPQFFKLDNQHDEMAHTNNPIELAAISYYIQKNSAPLETLSPPEGFKPDAARGRDAFAANGCLACHSHSEFPGIGMTHGPELSKIHGKLKAGKAGFDWLYTWIREPERYHPRTKMPNFFLKPEGSGEAATDAAADIAAFLLKLEGDASSFKPSATYDDPKVDDVALDGFVRSMLAKLLTTRQIDELLETGKFPIPADRIKTDEIELVGGDGELNGEEFKRRKLAYVGRKSITKYGCYGCHDIPKYEAARPIGTALQDWGKKDRSRLAFEHIHEYLHHHGNPEFGAEFENLDEKSIKRLNLSSPVGARVASLKPGRHAEGESLKLDDVVVSIDGVAIQNSKDVGNLLERSVVGSVMSVKVIRAGHEEDLKIVADGSLMDRAETAVGRGLTSEYKDPVERDHELSAAYYYESVTHHGRPGFLWQKLRQPRSYDYKTVETKTSFDDRLRMPKFPFSEDEIDAIATFILGLTAEPPAPEYMYNPTGPAGAKIRGEQLIQQYNCTGCHVLEMPKIKYDADVDSLTASDTSDSHPEAVKLLMALRPPRNGLTGTKKEVTIEGEKRTLSTVAFHGLVIDGPNPDDPPEQQEYVTELWENLQIAGKNFVPSSKFIFPASTLVSIEPAYGGRYAEWLVKFLVDSKKAKETTLAWQMSPPPLYKEGTKVQTPWLFSFLKNPGKIRHTTVLRMPRFNMSDDEAQSLANYFAAVDDVPYPYQLIVEREPGYLSAMEADFHKAFPDKKDDYLNESWKMLNGQLCIKCHSVGGQQVKISSATDIRGPNLDLATDRLRPDWTLLWLYNPKWITPYTSMPAPADPKTEGKIPELFGGSAAKQTVSLRDALMNYHRLLEREGKASPPPAAQAGGGD